MLNRKMNLQLFAEGEETPPETTTTIPTGKTFSEDYVRTIREEAKENRIARKAVEDELKTTKSKFKSFIGLKDDEDIDDSKLTAYQTAQQAAIADALARSNNRLIQAEVKSLDGYDIKLVERLLDKSKLTIGDDGEVTGLTEQLELLATEFPQLKTGKSSAGVNPTGDSTITKEQKEMAELRRSMGLPPLK